MSASLLIREEETRGLDDDLSTDIAPSESSRILLSRETDLLAVNNEIVAVDRDVVLEDAVNGVILQHVCEVIRLEKIVDTDHFDVLSEVFNRRAENHAADTAKAVNANLDSHFYTFSFLITPLGTFPNGKTGAKYRRNRPKSQEPQRIFDRNVAICRLHSCMTGNIASKSPNGTKSFACL